MTIIAGLLTLIVYSMLICTVTTLIRPQDLRCGSYKHVCLQTSMRDRHMSL